MLLYQAQEEAVKQFAEVLVDAGLLLKGLPIMDGRLHHVPTVGAKTKSDNAGVYVGHLDGGVPAGWFNNYRTDPMGEGEKWKATGVRDSRSPAEIQKAKEEAERLRAQEDQKRVEKEERIARWAERKWNRSEPATTHPYLERKGVEPHGLRVDDKNRLLVPMRDLEGRIWSLQTIAADGEKHYTAGGRKKGLHTVLGTYDPAKPLVLTEGFATAASIHQTTGLPVVVTFDSGNLQPVAKAYRARNAAQPLVFAADNDHHLTSKKSSSGRPMPNVGIEKAEEAARVVNGSVVIPAFERGNSGTDWNDYAAIYGSDAVSAAFQRTSVKGSARLNTDSFRELSQPKEPVKKEVRSMAIQESSASKREAQFERGDRVMVFQPYHYGGEPNKHPWTPAIAFQTYNEGKYLAYHDSPMFGMTGNIAIEDAVKSGKLRHATERDIAQHAAGFVAIEEKHFNDLNPSTSAESYVNKTMPDRPAERERLTRQEVELALNRGAGLAQKDLSGLDLSNLKFDGVNLAGSDLSNTRNSNTTYESSRLDGANFSDAVFRDSTIEHVFGVNSRWDRAQFDQTSMVFNNFGNASFRDATFRDRSLSRDREESSRKVRSGEGEEDNIRAASSERAPENAGWGEFAGRAGSFLRDIGKGLKDVSAEVYQKVRDWWRQPLQLAPEIDRNPAAAWAAQAPPAYEGTQERQPQAWDARQAELAQTQIYKHGNERSNHETLRPERVSEENRKQQIPEPGRSAEDRGNGNQEHGTVSTNAASAPERVQPTLIARNNFQFADLTGARFESIRVQDNDFRHAVLTNAQFPGELAESNKVDRGVEASSRKGGLDASVKDAVEPIRQMKTEAERKEDRAKLAETILRDIDSREQKLREGDSGQYRDADAMHLAKEMLRQVEAGADRIDLTTAYTAVDRTAAEERHVRAYNAVNPLIAEAYAKGITVDRGSASVERVQAITDEAARLHEDVNATNNRLDRKELVAETKNLEAESVSLRTESEAKENGLRSELDREGITPLIEMQQDRFDALLSVGVFDFGKSPEWRKEMDQKISDRFSSLSVESAASNKDPRALWFEAAKQVQQGESIGQQARDAVGQDRGRDIEAPDQGQTQKHEVRRAMALAR